jgi:hypothetical protein
MTTPVRTVVVTGIFVGPMLLGVSAAGLLPV